MSKKGENAVVKEKKIYIVLSQTGSFPSRFLKFFTHAEFNHVSISLSPDLQIMYSFGRRFAYYPFWSGFVAESPNFGTFKRFSNSKVLVLELSVENEQYEELRSRLAKMYKIKERYRYNYLGVGLAAFHIVFRQSHCYYCSEFIRDILVECQVTDAKLLPGIVQPMDFLSIPAAKTIYQGTLNNYSY